MNLIEKQKVKEAVDKIMSKKRKDKYKTAFDVHWEISKELEELKKELGLEDV